MNLLGIMTGLGENRNKMQITLQNKDTRRDEIDWVLKRLSLYKIAISDEGNIIQSDTHTKLTRTFLHCSLRQDYLRENRTLSGKELDKMLRLIVDRVVLTSVRMVKEKSHPEYIKDVEEKDEVFCATTDLNLS